MIRGSAQALAELDAQLQNLRPGEDWSGSGRFRGDTPMGLGEATRAMEELARLEELADQLGQSYPGARLDDIDLDELAAALGDAGGGRRPGRWRRWNANCASRACSNAHPTARCGCRPRRFAGSGESALRDVVDQIGSRRGERLHPAVRGRQGSRPAPSRPWAFGDTESWNVPRTLLNAQLRRAGGDAP